MGSFGEVFLCILCPCLFFARRRRQTTAPGPVQWQQRPPVYPDHEIYPNESGYPPVSPQYSPVAELPTSYQGQPINEWRVNIASDTPKAVSSFPKPRIVYRIDQLTGAQDVTRPVRAAGGR